MENKKRFRVWDFDLEIMHYPNSSYIGTGSDSKLIMIDLEGNISLLNAFGLPDERTNQLEIVNERFEIMESLYRYDCNDDEIFEGDIVKDINNDGKNSYGVVDKNEMNFVINNAFDYKGFFELINRERIEIIGNTFENKSKTP